MLSAGDAPLKIISVIVGVAVFSAFRGPFLPHQGGVGGGLLFNVFYPARKRCSDIVGTADELTY